MYATKEEVLEAKILNRIQKNAPKIEEVITKVQEDGVFMTNSLVPNRRMRFSADGDIYADYKGSPRRFNDFSLGQMADKTGIPVKYINYLSRSDWGRQLAAHILNEHAQKQDPQTYLVREVGETIRGVLSDRYKMMDSSTILLAYLQAALAQGAKLYDGLYTETKNYLEVVHPEIVPIETPNNGLLPLVMGARLRNSDFGDGALSLQVFTINVRCLNGLVGEQLLREIHLGGRIDNIQHFLTNETIRKETEAQAAVVGDTMKAIFSGEYRQKEIERIMVASDRIIDMEQQVKELPKFGVLQDEIKLLTNKLMANNPDDGVQGKNTMLKLVQGLTSVANEVEPTRTRELQEIASSLM